MHDVTGSRSVAVGGSDTLDVGDALLVTVGDGVGYRFSKDRNVRITNGVASIRLTPDGIFIDATKDLCISAGGVLKLSGHEVQIDGDPMVFLNSTKRATPVVAPVGKARAPAKPAAPGRAGQVSVAAPKLEGRTFAEAPGGVEDVEVEGDGHDLHLALASLPTSLDAVPAALHVDPEAAKAMREAAKDPEGSLAALVRRDATRALDLYRLAHGESLASLPSTLEVLGPVLTRPIPGLGGLTAADLGSLLNAGSAAGVLHLGGAGGEVLQLLALRTGAAPRAVNAERARASVAAHASSGAPPEEAIARALGEHGVAVYRGDPEGRFTRVEA
jgi:type VI secretion system secreted protein VgrG